MEQKHEDFKDFIYVSSKIYKLAGEIINGGCALMLNSDNKVYKFDINNPSHAGKFVGMSDRAVVQNESCPVTVTGVYENDMIGYVPGTRYYISATSILTSTPPTTGILHCVGVGAGVRKVLLNNDLEYELT